MPTFLLKTMVFIYIYIYQNHLRFALPYVELGTQLEFSPVGTPGGEFCGSSLGTFCTQLNAVSYREVQKRRVQRSGNIDTIEGINFLLRTKQLHFDQYLLQEAARQYLFFAFTMHRKIIYPTRKKFMQESDLSRSPQSRFHQLGLLHLISKLSGRHGYRSQQKSEKLSCNLQRD